MPAESGCINFNFFIPPFIRQKMDAAGETAASIFCLIQNVSFNFQINGCPTLVLSLTFSHSFSNSSFPLPQIGHLKSSGMVSDSRMYPQILQRYPFTFSGSGI